MRVFKFFLEIARPFKFYIFGMILVILLTAAESSIRPYIIKLLIDCISESSLSSIWYLAIIYGACKALVVAAWTFSDWCSVNFNGRFRSSVVANIIDKISHYPHSFFQDNLSGSIVAKMNDLFNLVSGIWYTINYQFISLALTIIISTTILAQVHFAFAVCNLIWIIIFLSISFHQLKKTISLTEEYAESKSEFWGYISDYITNIVNVRMFSSSSFEQKIFKKQSKNFIDKARKQGVYLTKFYAIQGVISIIYAISFLSMLIYLKNQNLVTVGDFGLVFMLNSNLSEELYAKSHQLRGFVLDFGTANQALKILDDSALLRLKEGIKTLHVTKGEIIFKDVQFSYPNVTPLFQNKSIIIGAGQKVGLVGYSGSGKSTFVNLILRLYDINSGQILIDNQDIYDVSLESLYRNIAIIPQDPLLFHRSLIDNIRYGKQEANDDDVYEASRRAHAEDFITKLPMQYDSLVGERGIKLSGGQRQRIAIARAMLKDASILILDEATSQLDSLTEDVIQESIQQLTQGKTTIIIAHRLSTLLQMDRILVFDSGRIVEDGNHSDLINLNGLYRSLWDTQVGGFIKQSKSI